MHYGYIPGPGQPNGEIALPAGQHTAGFAVGIVVIEAWYPFLPGNVANATTFDFPVIYKVLKGASIDRILSGDPELLPLVIQAGHELIGQGARCVVGACGSFANYQREAAAALPAPTLLSTMLQVPLILASLRPDQRLGVIAASPAALTPRVFEQCGITDPARLAITGAKDLPQFQGVMGCTGRFDSAALEAELVELARDLAARNPDLGAIILQCSDLPPYAWAIQQAVGLPVFDMTTLINWARLAVVRTPFRGYI